MAVQTTEAFADWALNVVRGGIAWTDVNNAAQGTSEPDGTFAVLEHPGGTSSDDIVVTWFNNQWAGIPDSAAIRGMEITFRIKGARNTGSPDDPAMNVVIYNDTEPLTIDGVLVGLPNLPSHILTTSLQDLVFGGPTTMPAAGGSGASAASIITPAYLKQHFWVALYINADDVDTISLDSVKAKVYWEVEGRGRYARDRLVR